MMIFYLIAEQEMLMTQHSTTKSHLHNSDMLEKLLRKRMAVGYWGSFNLNDRARVLVTQDVTIKSIHWIEICWKSFEKRLIITSWGSVS